MRFWAILFCLFSSPALAIELGMPVACIMDKECVVQNYMNHAENGGEAHDYTCGYLTYDGHHGTDFRVRNYAVLEEGVPVLATAEGMVEKVAIHRRQQGDIAVKQGGLWESGGCGTYITLDHGEGWKSTYCHLDVPGITVKEGQHVAMGAVLGHMGRTGNAAFPHVHYELSHNGQPVDPFTGGGAGACGMEAQALWSESALLQLSYKPVGVTDVGFTAAPLTAEQLHNGAAWQQQLPASTQEMHFTMELYGVREGDSLMLRLYAPDGSIMAQQEMRYTQSYALTFTTVSYPRGKEGWLPGAYRMQARLLRVNGPISGYLLNKSWAVSFKE